MSAETEGSGKVTATEAASPRMYWAFVLGYVLLSTALLIAVVRHPEKVTAGSYLVIDLVQLLTMAVLIWRWQRSNFPNTVRWGLLIASIFFVFLANNIDLIQLVGGVKYTPVPGLPIACDMIDVALVLLSCATTFRRPQVRVTNLIDGGMAIALTVLFFIRIFSVVSLGGSENLGDIVFIVRMFDALGVFLTLCAVVKLLGAEQASWRHFFFVLAAYLLTSTLFAAARNRMIIFTDAGSRPELLLLPQWLVSGLFCLRPLPRWLERYHPRTSTVNVTESLSPLFLGLGLLGVSISIWNGHPILGAMGVSIAVLGYGLRNVITQSEQMATERSLLASQAELQSLAVTDQLTGIPNRRCFDQMLKLEWSRATRMQHPLSLFLIDVDYFKNLNDKQGHPYGDQCLVEIASALQHVLGRGGDLVARYGGEEFAVILPTTGSSGAASVAVRMQEAVRSLNIPNETSIGFFVTVSIGMAVYEFPQTGTPAALLDAADRALYIAKQNGRNRIEHSSMQVLLDTGLMH